MITKIEGNCQYEGCNKPATTIASGRVSYDTREKSHPKPGLYCDSHALSVPLEGNPEYIEKCPNCRCHFGVN